MFNHLFTDTISVRRKADYKTTSRDEFNNPEFGEPASFPIVLTDIKVRIVFSGKSTKYGATGELIKPVGVMYFDKQFDIRAQDRINITDHPGYPSGVEYVVDSVVAAQMPSGVTDHFEAKLTLPQ